MMNRLIVFLVLLITCMRSSAIAQEPTATVLLFGDMHFDRGVRAAMLRYGNDYVFENVADTLRAADLAIGNLECPVTDRNSPRHARVVFRCDPAAAKIMADAGIDAVSIANNHIFDQGEQGLADTITNLTAAGVGAAGAGLTPEQAMRPWKAECNGIRFCLLAFAEPFLIAAPGAAPATEENVTRAVADAARQCDIVIVSFHWGLEFSSFATQDQKALARAAVDAGADLVFGHHPHVLQPHETINHTLVAYSLGNFVFDPRVTDSNESVILSATFSKQGLESYEFIPVAIENARPIVDE